MFTNAEVEVAATIRAGLKISRPIKGQPGPGGRSEVRRSTHEPRNSFADSIQHLARRIARSQPLEVCCEERQLAVPTVGQLTLLHSFNFIGQCRKLSLVLLEVRLPRGSQLTASLADTFCEVFSHPVRNKEFAVFGPTIGALGQPDLLLAERFTMSSRTIFPVRRAIPNVAVDYDQSGPVQGLFEHFEGPFQHVEVVGVAD